MPLWIDAAHLPLGCQAGSLRLLLCKVAVLLLPREASQCGGSQEQEASLMWEQPYDAVNVRHKR